MGKSKLFNKLVFVLMLVLSVNIFATECADSINQAFIVSTKKAAAAGNEIVPILKGMEALVSNLNIPNNATNPVTSYMSASQKDFFNEGMEKVQYYQSVQGIEDIYRNRLYLMKIIFNANEWWHNKMIEYVEKYSVIDGKDFAKWIENQNSNIEISNGLDYVNMLLSAQKELNDYPDFYRPNK